MLWEDQVSWSVIPTPDLYAILMLLAEWKSWAEALEESGLWARSSEQD